VKQNQGENGNQAVWQVIEKTRILHDQIAKKHPEQGEKP
jgi:hypothetical protein